HLCLALAYHISRPSQQGWLWLGFGLAWPKPWPGSAKLTTRCLATNGIKWYVGKWIGQFSTPMYRKCRLYIKYILSLVFNENSACWSRFLTWSNNESS